MTEEKKKIWIDHILTSTLHNLVKLFRRNVAFQEIIGKVFSSLCYTFCDLLNKDKAIHVFLNKIKDRKECHFLSIQDTNSFEYHPISSRLAEKKFKLLWDFLSSWDYESGFDSISDNSVNQKIKKIDKKNLYLILEILDEKIPTDCNQTGNVISFDFGTHNLGSFLLWGYPQTRLKADIDKRSLINFTDDCYFELSDLFCKDFNITKDTYFPSYRKPRWDTAAIMFTDIHNFTPLTEIIKNIHGTPKDLENDVLRYMLNKYIASMSNIVQKNCYGRISRFLGDGLLAVFGEHSTNHCQSVGDAVKSATLMIKEFNNNLKPDFLRKIFGGHYEFEVNEWIDIHLGIGIDFGTVLFGYLGDKQHREFSTLGHHVNFANRLTDEAARYDEEFKDLRPPILISRTAERCIRPWLKKDQLYELTLHLRGKAYPSKVFGLTEDTFDMEKYEKDRGINNFTKECYEFNISIN